MTFKFKSQATHDVLMLTAQAHQLLQLIGKDVSGPGVLEPDDMPQALAVLKSLPLETPASAQPQAPEGGDQDEDAEPPTGVGLRQRAWPLVQMIERALAAGKPIVWGV